MAGFMDWLRSDETEVWEALRGAPGPQTLNEICVSVGLARHIKKMSRKPDPNARPVPVSASFVGLQLKDMGKLGWLTEYRSEESFGEAMILTTRYVLNANGQAKRRGVVVELDDLGRPTDGPTAV